MVSLFFSYSHKDEDLRNELEVHLSLLKRSGLISTWHDRRITAGSELDHTIRAELESAQVILLLISAHFLASNYCFEIEMQRALEKHKAGSSIVVPIILHPCDWLQSELHNLRATPTDGKAISQHANLHEAFAIVTQDIRQAIEAKFGTPRSQSVCSSALAPVEYDPALRSSNLRIKRKFDDHEKDQFLEDSYEYIARYFDGSLKELEDRNRQIKTRFKRLDATSFSASIYENGDRVAQCSIWYGGGHFGSNSIVYSNTADVQRNSYNESLNIIDDGFTLQLKPMSMQMMFRGDRDKSLSQEGAAEYYWSMLICPLQN
jgi:hypothetical protein